MCVINTSGEGVLKRITVGGMGFSSFSNCGKKKKQTFMYILYLELKIFEEGEKPEIQKQEDDLPAGAVVFRNVHKHIF